MLVRSPMLFRRRHVRLFSGRASEGDSELPSARPRRSLFRYIAAASVVGGVGYYFASRGNKLRSNEDDSTSILADVRNGFADVFASSAPLLPPATADAYNRTPRTVVIGLDDVLTHLQWSRYGGWTTAVRSDVGAFLETLFKNNWEVVVWSSKPQYEADPLIALIDPLGVVKHRLYYEQTNMKRLALCKSIQRLGRDPRRLVVVDHESALYCGYESAVVRVGKFNGDKNDRALSAVRPASSSTQHDTTYTTCDRSLQSVNADRDGNAFAAEEALYRAEQTATRNAPD